jgi:hypothetical protein
MMQKVFTQGANGLSNGQLLMMLQQSLKLVGITPPTGVTVTLSAAQMILAGGAFARDVASGASTLQCVGDASTGVAGAAQILSALNIIDSTDSDIIGLGANITMAIATGGTNVLADLGAVISLISVVSDLSPDLFGSSAIATAGAKQQLNKAIQAVIAPQLANAALLVKAYNAGTLNMFDLIGQVALNDPTQFATLFPGLATFFPSYMPIKLSGTDTSSGIFSSSTDTETATFYSLVTTKQQVQDVLVEQYLTGPMNYFESFTTVAPVISLQAASVLSLILQSGGSGDTVMGFDFNVIGAMRGLGVTPSILGDDWLFKGLQRNENSVSDWQSTLPYPPITLPPVLPVQSSTIVNGVASLTPAQALQNQEASELISLQTLMQKYDEAGDIESLLQIPEAVAMLTRYANFHVNPTYYTAEMQQADNEAYTSKLTSLSSELSQCGSNDQATAIQLRAEINSLIAPTIPVGEITNMKLTGRSITTQAWFSPSMPIDPSTAEGTQFWTYVYANYTIDLSDYWKILNVLSTMQKSNLFEDDTQVQDFQGSITTLESLFQSAYAFVIQKQANYKARLAVAASLGIPINQLGTRYDTDNNLIFYQKKAS